MVHVEIFIGGKTGEATIGARWQKGVVQEFDSYKFEPKSYTPKQYYFRSIDTWLEGICKSFCKEHDWKQQNCSWVPGDKSIFGEEDGECQEDVDADEVEEEEKMGVQKEEKFAYFGPGNNYQMVKDILEKKGYK